jgi:hypothetical protein
MFAKSPLAKLNLTKRPKMMLQMTASPSATALTDTKVLMVTPSLGDTTVLTAKKTPAVT